MVVLGSAWRILGQSDRGLRLTALVVCGDSIKGSIGNHDVGRVSVGLTQDLGGTRRGSL